MSKMVVEDIYNIAGRGIVLVGTANCKPKLGPISIRNPDGKEWETELKGIEMFPKPFASLPRRVGFLARGVKEGDVEIGATIRFTRAQE